MAINQENVSQTQVKMGSALPTADKDWIKWIESNLNTVIIAGVILVVAIFGGGYLYNSKNKSKAEYNTKIYSFQTTTLTAFNTDGDAAKLVSGFKALQASTGSYIGLLPAAIKTADALKAKGKKTEALEILESVKNVSSNDYSQYLINSRLAALYEDLGKTQEAITTLTVMSKSNVDVFPGKTYMDLGRMYLKAGDKDKAKASFQYVLDKAKDDPEFVKMSKLYLSNL